ncbi:MAG TPA: hypothetical protein VFW19_17335 [Allosphingosinicella sp.]|nr:hypothetical protein [Allosphingosinicella sp.]
MDWHHIKLWVEHAVGLNMDAIHVYAGLFLQLGAAIVLRKSLKSPWPWLVVAGVEFANEVYDYTYEVWPDRDIQFAEGLRDMWNTMVLPTMLLLLARYAPHLLVGRAETAPPPSAGDPG